MQSGRSFMLRSFSHHLMKQLRSCENQLNCWKKNLKGLKDKICGLERITVIRIPLNEISMYNTYKG